MKIEWMMMIKLCLLFLIDKDILNEDELDEDSMNDDLDENTLNDDLDEKTLNDDLDENTLNDDVKIVSHMFGWRYFGLR